MSKKLVVWALIGFASYTGCSFVPAYLTHSQLEGAVANVLEQGNHALPDQTIRSKAVSAATSVSIPLNGDDVEVHRERRDGERIIRVQFDYPLTVSFLGAEREWTRQVQVARSFAVDEAAEARRERQETERRRAAEEQLERSMAAGREYRQRILEECRNNTKGDMVATHVYVTHPGGDSSIVECSTAYRWEKAGAR